MKFLASMGLVLLVIYQGCASSPDEEPPTQRVTIVKPCTCGGKTPVCLASGACGQCSASNAQACAGATPICDPVASKCVACPAGGCPSAAPTCSLSAAAKDIALGNRTMLSWLTSGATSVSIDQGVGAPKATSVAITPKATTTYTLTAINYLGTCTASATVTVGKPPTLGSSFVATPNVLITGQPGSSTLSWSAPGATSFAIDKGVGAVSGSSVAVTPSATTTYKLTASNAYGSATGTTTVTVGSLPKISAFWTSGTAAGPGVPTTVSWTVTNATKLTIDQGVGAVTGTKATVKPSGPTTYTLTASNAVGSATATTNVAFFPLTTISPQL
jgi:hypothetical protein